MMATAAVAYSSRWGASSMTRMRPNMLASSIPACQHSPRARMPLWRLAHSWASSPARASTEPLRRLAAPSPLAALRGRSSLRAKQTESSGLSIHARLRSTSPADVASMQAEMERRQREAYRQRNQSLFMYTAAVFIIGIGVTYAAVPLYRAFCSATGFSGTPLTDPARFEPSRLVPAYLNPSTGAQTRRIRVTFNADASDAIPWSFSPQQKEVNVLPGETALAFYTAKNRSKQDIVGIATYNVTPDKIAPYFAKIECFCFEEQKLLAGEEVDLPVFFFIDTDVLDDPNLRDVDDVVLSYTFFSARRNTVNGQLEPDTDLSAYTVGKD